MDKGFEVYCLRDAVFYDSPTAAQPENEFDLTGAELPLGWGRSTLGDWRMFCPDDLQLPDQGWKIHVSACLDNAETVLATVWDYCVDSNIAFKFICSLDMLLLRNSKYAHRGSSGKFITIFPVDESQLEIVLTELGELLDGQPGPYILSDLRWRAGPLYVRFGGFLEMFCLGEDGEMQPGITNEAGGVVPDRRDAIFHVPPWITLPACLEPQLAARNATTVDEMPYDIDEALHFSNGGGLYVGTQRPTGRRVVLKEARPHSGLSTDRADAIARLRGERDMLQRLGGLDLVPTLVDYFTLGEHEFLVQEFIEGETLNKLQVERYPLIHSGADVTSAADYAAWALDALDAIERAVDVLHERGIVHGDVHPANIMVRPDNRIVLIDLEVAALATEGRSQVLAAPGFFSSRGHTGFDIDRYALACLKLSMFMPLTALFGLDPEKPAQLAAAITELFGVPAAYFDDALRTIAGEDESGPATPAGARPRAVLDADPPSWERLRDAMSRAIIASASPERDDRLFPGDIEQFTPGGGLNLAHGAAGVLFALDVTGAGRRVEHDEWLLRQATTPPPGTPLGFYDGMHGVAYVLEHLGHRAAAINALDMCVGEMREGWERGLGLDLHRGLAGIGLNLIHFAEATGDGSMWDLAHRVATVTADRLGDEDSVAEVSGGKHSYAGLTRGSSGPALLLLRLYEQTGESEFLDLAHTALGQDLRRCLLQDGNVLEVNEGRRSMPYLADGSVGIGLVLDRYLMYREDERFADAATAIRRAAESQFYAEPGLFYGRAGMILYLGRDRMPGAAGAPDPVAAAHVRRLSWHAVTYAGGLAFPGDQLLRLSMDLATGTAGVMLAVGAALHDASVHLPFLGPRRAERIPTSSGSLATTERR